MKYEYDNGSSSKNQPDSQPLDSENNGLRENFTSADSVSSRIDGLREQLHISLREQDFRRATRLAIKRLKLIENQPPCYEESLRAFNELGSILFHRGELLSAERQNMRADVLYRAAENCFAAGLSRLNSVYDVAESPLERELQVNLAATKERTFKPTETEQLLRAATKGAENQKADFPHRHAAYREYDERRQRLDDFLERRKETFAVRHSLGRVNPLLVHVEEGAAVIFGLALGDALGWPTEFLKRNEIRRRYGKDGIQQPSADAIFTDDTQMTIAIAKALITHGTASTDELMSQFASNFIEWSRSPENNRAPGNACMNSIRRLIDGAHWSNSAEPGSKGCGAAMRVAPIGFLYQHEPERLREIAILSGRITHNHPTSDSATVAAAYLVKLALDKTPLEEMLDKTIAFVGSQSGEFNDKMLQVKEALHLDNEEDALKSLGEGWVAEEAIALAMYCVLKNPTSWRDTVVRAANTNGDSDSIASIAGGIQGARLGIESIPKPWIARLEKNEQLYDEACHLARLKHRALSS